MGVEQGVGFPITAYDVFSGAFDKLQQRVTAAQSSFQKLSGTLAGISSVLTVAGFAAFIKGVADSHEEVGKLSQKLGIGVGELSQYKYALSQSDVSLESFGKGVKTLSQKMVEATDSTSKAGRIFTTLGVDLGRGTTPAVEKIADAFAKLPDGATKAALATELFGKNGMEMIPFLNQGSAGIKLMKEEAARLGLVMTEETTKAAQEFNDNLKTINASSQRLGITIMNELAPAMVRITGAMKEAVAEGGLLYGIWVAMGGVASELLGLNQDPTAKRLKEVNNEMARLQETIAKGPAQLFDGVLDRGPIIQAQRELAKLREELKLLQAMKDTKWRPQEGGAFDFGPGGKQLGSGGDGGLGGRINSILSGSNVSKGMSDFARAFEELQAKILGAAAALDTGFTKSLGELNIAFVTGRINVDQYAKLIDLLIQQQPFYQKGIERILKTEKLLEEQREQDRKDREDLIKLGDAKIKQLAVDNELMQLEADLLGASTVQRELGLNAFQKEIALRGVTDDYQRSTIERLYDERAALILVRDARLRAFDNTTGMWRDLADGARDFAQNVRSVGDAYDWLKNKAIQVGNEILGIFAQKIMLNIGATLTTGAASSALASQAGNVGQGTFSGVAGQFAGSALNTGAGALLAGGGAGGFTTAFSAGYTAQAAYLAGTAETAAASGTLAGSMGAGMAEIYSALASIPVWGWIALAVIAIGAWIAGNHKGGPKVGGSFMGSFDSSGKMVGSLATPGTDNGRFFTPNQMDSEAQKLVEGIGKSFAATLDRFGGTSGNFGFGLGFDHDPQGTAQSRVSSMVTDANGKIIYKVADRSMDDKEVPAALMLEGRRMVLAALQASQLPPAIAAILKTVDAATASSEQLDAVFALADAFKTLSDALGHMTTVDLVAQASMTAMDMFAKQGTALLDLAGKTDMSVGSLQNLTAATIDFKTAAAQLILGFENSKRQIDDMFGATSRGIKLAGLDGQGKYNFYQNEAERLLQQALKSNDAGEIQRLAGLINQDINAAFALLTPEQQASMQQDWLTRIDKTNADLQAHLTELQTQAQDKVNETLDKMKGIMEKAAADFSTAAATMTTAGNHIAAGSHVDIDVNIHGGDADVIVNDGG